jgi:arylsulfatase A-like enzyme
MGLIAQLDHHIGRVLDALDASGAASDTLIVLCADHGDMLGDHWLGEKELFYEQAVRTPMIVVDPRAQAQATRGKAVADMVEAIDIVPTLLDALAVPGDNHRLEGRSLLPLVHGQSVNWRDAVFSEADYGFRQARLTLGRAPGECRGWMVRTGRFKYVEWEGLRPQLFDLQEDPDELYDLGASAANGPVAREMRDRLLHWSLQRKTRSTLSDEQVALRTEAASKHGIFIGFW